MKKFPQSASLVSLLLTCIEGMGLALIAWVALKHVKEPATAQAQLMFNFIVVIGAVIILYQMYQDYSRTGPNPRVMLYGTVALVSVLAVVGNFGDDMVREPGYLALFIGAVAFCQIVKLSCQMASSQPDAQRLYDVRQGIPVTLQARMATGRDRRFIAAHEAGHALLYAAWSPYPDALRVVVKAGSDGSNSLGYVNDGQQRHLLTDKTFAEWDMLMSLAGSAGERCYTGEMSLGAINDNQRWLSVATPYLSCYPQSGIFYTDPASQLEIEVNQRHLSALRTAQNALLDAFFEQNRDVHTRLTEALLAGSTLTGAELHSFFADVQLPDGIPRPQNVNTLA